MYSPPLAPIVLFCFNRPDKTKIVLEELAKNDLAKDSDIYIFCDGPRNIKEMNLIKEVHEIAEAASGFKNKHIIKKEINWGLRASVIHGINQVFKTHDCVIVIEDDIVTSKKFLKFSNEALKFYKDEPDIWCVTGFNYPKNLINYPKEYDEDIFFVKGRNSSWGWATWKDRWNKIDFDVSDYESFAKDKKLISEFNKTGGNMFEMLKMQKAEKINSWAVPMSYAMFRNNAYSVHSFRPLVKNIGFDATGTHTVSDMDLTSFEFENYGDFRWKNFEEIKNNSLAEKAYFKFYKDKSSLLKWFSSKKRRRNLLWLSLGFLLSEIFSNLMS